MATEALYTRLRGFISAHPPVWSTRGTLACNQCGSPKLTARGTYEAVTLTYDQWQCDDCGAWMRGAFQSRISSLRGVK